MKRFWLVLLSLGLVMAFSASVFAVDVKFSGEYFVGGMYLDKTTVMKDTATDGPSTALYYQRMRLKTEFVVAPGLSLVTRADIMERAWGAARSTPGTAADTNSAGTAAENENIAFDYLYVTYASPIGVFGVGYQPNGTWATVFANSETPLPKITYALPIGDFTLLLQMGKGADQSRTAKYASPYSDADYDVYYLMGMYKFKQGVAGLGLFGLRNKTTKPLGYEAQVFLIEPYFQAQFGPVKVQAEVDYATGKQRKYESGGSDINYDSWAGWIDATATFGPIYFGGTFAYVGGDDPATTDKNEGYWTGGMDFNPCLLLWNYDRYYWAGTMPGYGAATNSGPMTNAFFYQGRVGVKPSDKLDIMASLSYANADKKPTGYSDAYGWEIDVTGTYKITNNLSYMLGVGYLMTGDYYKAGTAGVSVRDNYIVVNKLTLTF